MRIRRPGRLMLFAVLLTGSIISALANPAPTPNVPTADYVKGLALRWYTQMQAGQIDRTQLTAAYNAQLMDDTVREMSHKVNGALPNSAEILQNPTMGDQKFYLVKLIFPRGDAASLLIGFDAEGKITGIDFLSMAAD
jgi:hypothetical protein